MQCLCDNNLFAKVKKCKFDIAKMNFLGYIISPDSLQMDNKKIQVIRDWPIVIE